MTTEALRALQAFVDLDDADIQRYSYRWSDALANARAALAHPPEGARPINATAQELACTQQPRTAVASVAVAPHAGAQTLPAAGWKLVPIEPTPAMLACIVHYDWPADWEAGKKLQREQFMVRRLDRDACVPMKTEYERAVGQYQRLIAAAPGVPSDLGAESQGDLTEHSGSVDAAAPSQIER